MTAWSRKATIMGDSTWCWKTARIVTENGKLEWDHKRVSLLRKVMDTGACDFEMDIDTTKEVAKAGFRVHE